MKYIVTNFAYGTGPYLRTTDLAIAFNDALEELGHGRLPIIVPWVYGEKQRKIMLEEFREHDALHPREILLDGGLGEILAKIFYGESTYEKYLERWISESGKAGEEAKRHLSSNFPVETLRGEKHTADGTCIAVELNRSPRVHFGVAPSYSTTFGYTSEILAEALKEPKGNISVRPELLEQGVAVADAIESQQEMRFIARPGTFSWDPSYVPRHGGEFCPPIGPSLPKANDKNLTPGIYVTVTGIPGLERLYREAKELGMVLYSNDTEAVPRSIRALPEVLGSSAIHLHVARSGWSSVWLSMFLGVPMVVPSFDPSDDPEIYFNNRAVEALGVGIVYRGQSLEELLGMSGKVMQKQGEAKSAVMKAWGFIDGTRFCARRFAEDFKKKGF